MNVKIYTTPNCPFCQMAKNFLRERDIKFEEIDVQENQKAAEEMVRKSGQLGVPVIEINNKIIVGFDEKAIKEALNLK